MAQDIQYSVYQCGGKVACRVCSKPLGCGQAERNWGALKHLKTGKRSHLSAEKAERQATVYGAACIEKSRAIQAAEERGGFILETRWTDADIAVQMGLESWGGMEVPVPVVPKRLFRAWIEDWEWDAIRHKDVVSEAKLVQKYTGLRFVDPDLDRRVGELDTYLVESNLEFQGGKGGSGWCLIGTRDRDGGMEPWEIHLTIDLIAEYEQPAELNVEIIVNDELRNANYERIDEEASKKRPAAKRKANKK